MKTITRIFGMLFPALALAACQQDPVEETTTVGDITITTENGMIRSPKWLVDKVEEVADRYGLTPSGGGIYPWVYSVTCNGQVYILLFDVFNSCWTCGLLYFTLSGESIEPDGDPNSETLYNRLEEARLETGALLWRQPTTRTSGFTRALVSEVLVQTPMGSPVPDTWSTTESHTSADVQYWLSYVGSTYPRATILSNPTTTYNCHGYAWYMREGGSPVWMGGYTNPTNIYVQDESYVTSSWS